MTLGDIIKKYRDEHSLSMDSFSEKSGISKAYISLLEKNKHPKTGKTIAPSVQCIKQAASGMGMDFNDLFNMIDGNVSLDEIDSINSAHVGKTLQKLRKQKKLTVKETTDKLLSMGYEISNKTLSGYETGIRMPNADVFMALCKIYDCKNILEMFSFINADYSIPTDDEWNMIEKYRLISKYSPDGTSVIDTILDREHSIAEKLKEQSEQIQKIDIETAEKSVSKRIISYYQKLASAGKGEYLFDGIPTDLIEVANTAISREADFVIGVNGHSMEPTYCDGEKVFVKKMPDIATGEIGIFLKGNECYIKELGTNRLISHNADKNTYPDIPANESIILVGKVLGKAND